jgi:hypothetical protein
MGEVPIPHMGSQASWPGSEDPATRAANSGFSLTSLNRA